MKTFTHVSASQISTYLSCQRQWYWNKIIGLPSPQKPSAALGEAVHTSIEKYLDGESTLHPVAVPGKAKLDELRALRPLIETKMQRPLSNGLTFVGRIDVLAPEQALVVDHKTTSSLQYAKSEEELQRDPQMLAYAYEVLARTDADTVRVAHNVLLTRGSGHRYTEAELSRAEILSGWKRLEAVTDAMKATALVPSPTEVPATWSACSAYGGCPYREQCQSAKLAERSPYDGMESAVTSSTTSEVNTMSKHTASVLRSMGLDDATIKAAIQRGTCTDDLGLSGGAAPAPTVVAAQVNPPEAPESPRTRKETVVTPPAPVGKSPEQILRDQMALLVSLGWSQDELDALSDDTFQRAVEERTKRADVNVVRGTGLVQGNEYDDLIVGFEPVVQEAPKPTRRLVRSPVTVAPVVVEAPVEVVETVVEEKPKRGRKPGVVQSVPAELVRAEEPVVEAKPEPVVEAPVEVKPTPVVETPKPKAATAATLVLYVDCVPEKGVEFQDLSDMLAPYMRKVEQAEKVAHYGLVQYNNGEKMVVGYLLADLAKFTGHITVDSRLPVAVRALEVLRPVASVVISGRR